MTAYEKAMSGPRTAIGVGRIKPGSVAAVVTEYYDSQLFFTSKGAGTQRMRRGILERFRAAYGERPMAPLSTEWIEALLDSKPPHAARSWLVTLRSLCKFAVKRRYLRADPTASSCRDLCWNWVTRSPAFREYRVRPRRQLADRWWQASANRQPFAC
jgi:hypothetical protein